jgi:polyhydroxyalkanoate synthesis repressor PhaR
MEQMSTKSDSTREENQAQTRLLEIKKYANRRYYDATHSRHLTLEEIRSMVQQGFDVRVTDGKTGADLTAQVLTQIILELDTPKLDSLPVPLLVRLIRMNDALVKDFIEKYFNQALKTFFDQQQRLEEQFRQVQGLPASLPSLSQWTQAMWQPFAPKPEGPSSVSEDPTRRPAPTAPDVEELRGLVQKLQRQVTRLQRRPARRKRPARGK